VRTLLDPARYTIQYYKPTDRPSRQLFTQLVLKVKAIATAAGYTWRDIAACKV
jgi:hypothetical protein